MPVVIVAGGDVHPAATTECAQQAADSDERWQGAPRVSRASDQIPKRHQSKARARGQGDEDVEEGALRVPVADRAVFRLGVSTARGIALGFHLRGHAWKPFLRIAGDLRASRVSVAGIRRQRRETHLILDNLAVI